MKIQYANVRSKLNRLTLEKRKVSRNKGVRNMNIGFELKLLITAQIGNFVEEKLVKSHLLCCLLYMYNSVWNSSFSIWYDKTWVWVYGFWVLSLKSDKFKINPMIFMIKTKDKGEIEEIKIHSYIESFYATLLVFSFYFLRILFFINIFSSSFFFLFFT